ncbi:MAG: heavy metal translocating P-type ATPase [Bacillota bacterium]
MLRDRRILHLLISGTLIAAWLGGGGIGARILMAAAAVVAGLPIAHRAVHSLRYKVIGIELLVTVATVGALMIGEYWEAAAVTFLFQLGGTLEAYTLGKTRSSLQKLMSLAPDRAVVRRDGEEREVPAEGVAAGDTVLVRSGERIAVDGQVLEGHGLVNQAAITGESVPVQREAGQPVFSGSVLEVGYLEVRADRVGSETTFSRVLQLVEEAQDAKAPTQRFVDRFARYYTPAAMVLALTVYLITRDLEKALTLLVIACPGALVIATPVAVVAGIGAAARRGVLLKGGDALERAARVAAVAFDKTGTLTQGRPEVTALRSFGPEESELLRLAAGAELRSEHHLARAVLRRAERDGITPPEPEAFEVRPGLGVVARFAGAGGDVLVGNGRLMAAMGVTVPPEAEQYAAGQDAGGETAVLVGLGGRVAGVMLVADPVRPEAPEAVADLRRTGIRQTVMLTGDHAAAARSVADGVGVDEVHAALLPEDKVRLLRGYRDSTGRPIAMVGDGINDAPSLAAADLGVAMGGSGTDVAMETADMVILSDRLDRLAEGLRISRAAVRIMRQNLVFAVAVGLLLLAGVLTGSVFLAGGMLVHEASVLLVILNAMRLLRLGHREHREAAGPAGGTARADAGSA